MNKSVFFYMFASMIIFVSACSKDDDSGNDGPGTGDPSFSGVNKITLNINGTSQEFIFADEPAIGSELSAYGIRETEDDSVYTEIAMAANNHFDHVSTAALFISYFGDGAGEQNISYDLEDESGLDNYSGSGLIFLTDTTTMPLMYLFEQATANITSYGEVGGYIEGTFEASVISLAGIPQPTASAIGNFKVKRFSDGK